MSRKSKSLDTRVAEEELPPWVVLIDTETVDVGDGQQEFLLGCFEVWLVNDKGLPRRDSQAGPQASRQHVVPFRRGHFTSEDELYELLQSLTHSRCVAHNWQFDASVIRLGAKATRDKHQYWLDMEACSFPLDKGFAPFNVTICFKSGARAQFICNTNFHKTSLAALGESFGIAKLPMPDLHQGLLADRRLLSQDFDGMDSTVLGHVSPGGIVDVLRYCRRDVEVLREAWFSLFTFSDAMAGTTPGLTVASMSLRLFRRRWLGLTKKRHDKIIGSLDCEAVAEAEEAAFHGGRTETFWHGRPPAGQLLRKYDVVSMYPSVMTGAVPVQYLGSGTESEVLDWCDGGNDRTYLAHVTVDIPPDGNGWLGWEGCTIPGRGLCFPAGRWTTWVWLPMIRIALEQGWVLEIDRVHTYRTVRLFRQYVEDIYSMRAEAKRRGDGPQSLLLKYALNSLYGKFGQRCFGEWQKVEGEDLAWQRQSRGAEWDRWTDFPCGDPALPLSDYLSNTDGLWRFEPARDGMGERSVCSIAGWITAAARAKLWRAMAGLHQAGATVFMCDTDSIITDGVMETGKELGQWDLEETAPSAACRFNAPKDYTFNDKAKCKGIRAAVDGVRDYEQARFSRWQTHLLSRSVEVREQLERGAVVTQQAKHVSGENKKRQQHGEGSATTPLVLPLE